METLNDKQTAILKVISYLDLFDCPLTINEIHDYLELPININELRITLTELVAAGKLQNQQGFYGLDLEAIIERQNRFTYSRRKLKKACLIAAIFARLPWVRLVALANQIGPHNFREQGDLDLLIICAPGRIWLTRLLTAGLMALTGQRPTAIKTRDQICLSFFITSDNLSFEPYLLNSADLYFRYWLVGLRVLYDAGDYYHQLLKANRSLTEYLPNWLADKERWLAEGQDRGWRWLEILKPWEELAKRWQLARLPAELKAAQTNGQVVINDQVLKLHVKDRRRQFQKSFETKWQELKNKL